MAAETPFFSIIIPAYARPNRLAACLAAVARLDYPRDCFEAIVVDDGSPQALNVVVDQTRSELDITLIRQESAGPAAARNRGAGQAHGRFLAFLDDDCTPCSSWLRHFADGFSGSPDLLLGGSTANALAHNPYAEASHLLRDHLYEYDLQEFGQSRFFSSNNIALSADRFHALGGFDTSFPLAAGEDRDFCNRWLHAGRRLHYVPQARVKHMQKLNGRTFLSLHFGYGKGNFNYQKKRAARGNGGNRPEPWRFYRGLLASPWKITNGLRAAHLSLLMFLSQAANALGYFRASLAD